MFASYKKHTNKVADLYRWRFGDTIPVIETNYQTAELIKYMNNCFFETKVSFLTREPERANEFWQISENDTEKAQTLGANN